MIKAKVYDAIIGTSFLLGVGGLGGACETGNGFLLSALLFIISVALGFYRYG